MPATTRNVFNKTYETDFRAAVHKINSAVGRGFSKSSGYEKVGVLLMHWENNNVPQAVPAKDRLAAVFRDIYHYGVEPHIIRLNPLGGGPERLLEKRINDFKAKYEGPNSLMIYYYIGHAGVAQDISVWAGANYPGVPFVRWNSHLRRVADLGWGDTLYL